MTPHGALMDEVVRECARRMPAAAPEAEVNVWLLSHSCAPGPASKPAPCSSAKQWLDAPPEPDRRRRPTRSGQGDAGPCAGPAGGMPRRDQGTHGRRRGSENAHGVLRRRRRKRSLRSSALSLSARDRDRACRQRLSGRSAGDRRLRWRWRREPPPPARRRTSRPSATAAKVRTHPGRLLRADHLAPPLQLCAHRPPRRTAASEPVPMIGLRDLRSVCSLCSVCSVCSVCLFSLV